MVSERDIKGMEQAEEVSRTCQVKKKKDKSKRLSPKKTDPVSSAHSAFNDVFGTNFGFTRVLLYLVVVDVVKVVIIAVEVVVDAILESSLL